MISYPSETLVSLVNLSLISLVGMIYSDLRAESLAHVSCSGGTFNLQVTPWSAHAVSHTRLQPSCFGLRAFDLQLLPTSACLFIRSPQMRHRHGFDSTDHKFCLSFFSLPFAMFSCIVISHFLKLLFS